MNTVQIYHNPRCSKSRATLELLRERGIEPQVILYLETGPDAAALRALLNKLAAAAKDLVRVNEPEFKQTGYRADDLSAEQVVDCLVRFPKLMQRPVVVNGDVAVIGRPPEKVLEIL